MWNSEDIAGNNISEKMKIVEYIFISFEVFLTVTFQLVYGKNIDYARKLDYFI